MEKAEIYLADLVRVVSLALEFTAVLCIIVGFIKSFILLLERRKLHFSPLHNRIRFQFGGWLILALEFQLASDIIKTTTAPTYEHLIQLGAIAVIRTFLNYFLSKELKELPELISKNVKTQHETDTKS
jgi:uncharacterized membrane protein